MRLQHKSAIVTGAGAGIGAATARLLVTAHAPWSKELPAGRLGTPEDTANVVAYLASDDAYFVTGALWVIDGGRLIAGMG